MILFVTPSVFGLLCLLLQTGRLHCEVIQVLH